MSDVSAELVKDLRVKTGCGFMECKKALQESGGNMDAAVTLLRQKGLAKAASRAGRAADQGCVESYIHAGGKIGVLVEVNCETDFVARTDIFRLLVKNVAMHIAAANPLYVNTQDIPAEVLEKEREIYGVQARESGKPAHVLEKMIDGKIKKYCEEVCLLEQPYIREPEKKIADIVKEAAAAVGENIAVRRFSRFALGQSQDN